LPTQLGGYRIVSKLGEGGMGVVYQAVQLSLDRPVALKVIKGTFTSDRPFVARFLREARVAARIDHPNVVAIYDTGEADGQLFTAQQFVPGGDLQQRMLSGGAFPEGTALRIAAECGRGLRAIHLAGLVHRDIKPSNIFIAADDSVKIGDLGLVRSVIDDERLTFSGDLVGTPAYMSPEQALAEQDVDARTDLYALGASLFHLLTGQAPFGGRSPFLIGHQVLAEMAPDPRQHNPAISAETCAIIHHAMRKERTLRYQTADEMVEDLVLVGSGRPLRYARVAEMRAERQATLIGAAMTGGEGRRLRLGPAALALAAVVSVAGALVIGLRLAGGPPPLAPPALPVGAGFPPAEPLPLPERPAALPEAILDQEVAEHPLSAESVPVHTAPAAVPRPDQDGALAPPAVRELEASGEHPAPVDGRVPDVASGERVGSPGQDPLALVAQAQAQAVAQARPQAQRVNPEAEQGPEVAARPAIPAADGAAGAAPPFRAIEVTPETVAPPGAVAPPGSEVLAIAANAAAAGTLSASSPAGPGLAAEQRHRIPAWASASGLDAFGPWAEISVGPARQRFRCCPAGTFWMGSPADEEGRASGEGLHRTTISTAYWLADTECTQILWATVMSANPSSTHGSDLPVDQVSWQASQEFCARLSMRIAGMHARLPSEAEWESACRAGSRGPFSGGADPASIAWFAGNADARPHVVATRQANALGLFDCQGNVWEWCQAPDPGYPQPDPLTDQHVFRGGAWTSAIKMCRAAERGASEGGEGFVGSGLRVAVDADGR
jgi:hypothetical protein